MGPLKSESHKSGLKANANQKTSVFLYSLSANVISKMLPLKSIPWKVLRIGVLWIQGPGGSHVFLRRIIVLMQKHM